MPAGKPKRRPAAPSALGDAGKACWRAVWAEVPAGLELDERERLILREAAGVADDLDRLEGMLALAGDEVVVRLLSERRQQRLAFGRLLAQLDLGDANTVVRPASRRAQHAARARWGASSGQGA